VTADPAALAAARDRLAAAQTALLAALVTGAEPPPGFDPDRLRLQADALIAKRRAVVARLRPDLVEAAGEGFAERFSAYARARPRPAAGSRADAEEFGRTLPRRPARWPRLARRS